MSDTTIQSLRLPRDLTERIQAYQAAASKKAGGVHVTFAGAVRALLEKGLASSRSHHKAK